MTTDNLDNKKNVEHVGQRLCSAREKLELTQQYVAERLCLKTSTIREIEENKLNNIAATFRRGYIKSYAKLVGIPESEINELLDEPAPVALVSSYKESFSAKQNNKPPFLSKLVWPAIFVSLILTIFFWRHYTTKPSFFSDFEQQDSIQEDTTSNNPQLSAMIPEESQTHIETENEKTLNGISDTVEEEVEVTDTINRVENKNIPEATKNSEKNDTGAINNEEKITNIIDAKNNNNIYSSKIYPKLIMDSVVNSKKRLQFSFSEDTWLQVISANKAVLYTGIKPAESELTLTGIPPFFIIIGKPKAVKLRYNDKLVDLVEFTRSSKIARFTLQP